jgi:hypothetical protein
VDEDWPSEDLDEIAPEPERPRGRQGRHVDLVDQMAEKGRLGEDLDIEKGGIRLRRNRCQLVEPVQTARRVDVEHRHREDQPPRKCRETTTQPPEQPSAAAADDVVAVVERLEYRFKMPGGPRLLGRRDEHDGSGRPLQPKLQGPMLAPARDRHDIHLGRSPSTGEQVTQAGADRIGAGGVAVVEYDHPDVGVGQRFAVKVGFVRIDVFVMLGRGHSASRRLGSDRLGGEPAFNGRAECVLKPPR